MIDNSKDEEIIDNNLVVEYAEKLIKEHRGLYDKKVFIKMNRFNAIKSSIITAKRLASVTARKFYYKVIKYLEDEQS